IKLLQLSNLDLAAYVEGELERNPLLERSSEGPAEGNQREEASVEAPGEAAEVNGSAAIEDSFDTGIENVFPDSAEAPARPAQSEPAAYSEWAGVGSGGREDGDYNLEAFVSAEATLADHLGEQLALAIADPVRRMIGRNLIDLVDEAGYLSGDLAAVAERLGAPLSEIETVLAILQGFDPPGVCARNLSECLTIQLKEQNRFDPAMQALLGHLDLVARRDVSSLRRLCGVDDADLADMVAEIRRLNPKPGLAFGSAVVQPIVPDVFVRVSPEGGWLVELNSDTLPKVLVNQ